MKRILLFFIILQVSCSDEKSVAVNPIDSYTSQIEKARTVIQDVRGLSFITPVKVGNLSRAEYAKRFKPRLDSNEYMIAFKQIGLIPDTLKSINAYLTASNSSFAAAFYTFETDSITVVDIDKYTKVNFEVIMAHEFVHALQDQYYHPTSSVIFPYESMSHYNSDFYLARKCMIEGDARFSEIKYASVNDYLSQSVTQYIKNKCDSFYLKLKSESIPRYMSIQSNFPYWTGANYVMQLYSKEGWAPVNEMFHANRVISTAEIILSKWIEPKIFNMTSLAIALQRNVNKIRFMDDDNYGPVLMMALFADYCTMDDFRSAFGWQGDRMLYVLSDAKKYGSFVWAMAFESDARANRMGSIISSFLQNQRLNNSTFSESKGSVENHKIFQISDLTAHVIQNGSMLFWIENVDNSQQWADDLCKTPLAKSWEPAIRPDSEHVKTKRLLLDRMFGF